MPNPITTPNIYDYIVLAGIKSPGLCEISGASSPRTWEKKKGTGSSGATVTYQGDDLASFTVILKFFELTHFGEWDSFKLLLSKPSNAKNPIALDIVHPYLEELNIKSVVVEDVTQITQTGDGEWNVTIKFLQYRKPKPASGTPNGSKGSTDKATGKAPETAADRNEATIAALHKQAQEAGVL